MPARSCRKEELLRVGWPGRVVTENSLAGAIGRLRRTRRSGRRVPARRPWLRLPARRRPAARGRFSARAGNDRFAGGERRPSCAARCAATPLVDTLLVGTTLLLAAVGAIHIGSRSPGPASPCAPTSPQEGTSASIAILPFLDLERTTRPELLLGRPRRATARQPGAHPANPRGQSYFVIRVPWPGSRPSEHRQQTQCPDRARRQRAQVGWPPARDRAADQVGRRLSPLVRNLRSADHRTVRDAGRDRARDRQRTAH